MTCSIIQSRRMIYPIGTFHIFTVSLNIYMTCLNKYMNIEKGNCAYALVKYMSLYCI